MPATLVVAKSEKPLKKGRTKDKEDKPEKGDKGGGKGGSAAAASLPTLKVPASLSKDKEMSKLFELVVKALLHSLQIGRDVCSVIFLTYLVASAEAVIEQAVDQNQSYNQAVQKRGHGLGPPHIWTFGGLLTAANEAVEGLDAEVGKDEEDLKKVKEWGARLLKEYGDASKELKQELVLFCRISRTFKDDSHRITLAFGTSEPGKNLREYVQKAFGLLEYEQRFGRAPPSHQERSLQHFLEDMASR